eukprot:7678896-Pyramimonas_sp.AAC.1
MAPSDWPGDAGLVTLCLAPSHAVVVWSSMVVVTFVESLLFGHFCLVTFVLLVIRGGGGRQAADPARGRRRCKWAPNSLICRRCGPHSESRTRAE